MEWEQLLHSSSACWYVKGRREPYKTFMVANNRPKGKQLQWDLRPSYYMLTHFNRTNKEENTTQDNEMN